MRIGMFLTAALFCAALFAGPVEDLKPGCWYEVPNSKLDAVKPDPLPPGSFSGLISAWNSGAYDTKRDRFLVWGGGHCDYAGNEIYAFDVNTLAWARIWGPTPNQYIRACDISYQTYLNGDPSARHIYDGLEYIPDPVDAMMIVGGPWWGSSGGGGTWLFKFGTNAWEQKLNEPDSRNGVEIAYDPVTGHVFERGSYWISEYDFQAETWTKRNTQSPSGNGGWWGQSTGAIDPKRRKMVFACASVWAIYDLTTNQTTWPATSGDNQILNTAVPGLDYDPVSDKMVAWSGGTDVYTFDIDSLKWTRRPPSAANTVTPPAGVSQGTYGRFRYIPSKNAFICVSGVSQNVFIYKLAPGGGTRVERARAAESGLSVSPNPCRDRTYITSVPGRVRVCDIRGKTMKMFVACKGERLAWDTRAYPAGVYLVGLEANGRRAVSRIFVHR